jgi:predicted DCC family thiol-disulfide oxidoreductase YuxK
LNHKIILFDGVCNLCNYWVDFVIKRDKKDSFRFAALQSEPGQNILNNFNLNPDIVDSFILVEDKNFCIKSTASLKVIKELNSLLKIFYPAIILPKPIRDFIYDLVAKHRYKLFGKKETCRIPSQSELAKFL